MPWLRCCFMASTEDLELLAAEVGGELDGAAEGRHVAVQDVPGQKYRRVQSGRLGTEMPFDGHLFLRSSRGLRISATCSRRCQAERFSITPWAARSRLSVSASSAICRRRSAARAIARSKYHVVPAARSAFGVGGIWMVSDFAVMMKFSAAANTAPLLGVMREDLFIADALASAGAKSAHLACCCWRAGHGSCA